MTVNNHNIQRTSAANRLQKTLTGSSRHFTCSMQMSFRLWLTRILQRSLELFISSVVVITMSLPLTIALVIRKMVRGNDIFSNSTVIGRNGIPLTIRYFNLHSRPTASSMALFYHVISGELSIVGMDLKGAANSSPFPEYGYLHSEKPGVISLWQVRNNTNTSHEGLLATEWEHFFTKSARSDMLLLLRAIPSSLFASNLQANSDYIDLFGIHCANITMNDAVELVITKAKDSSDTTPIFFVNPDCLNTSFRDEQYHHILQSASVVLPDGIGLTIAGKILHTPLKENVNGTDMLPFLSVAASGNGLSLFLLGARPGIADKMKNQIRERFGVSVAGTHHGYFDHEAKSESIIRAINNSGADIVLVALGAPLQEKWIWENRHRMTAGVVMGVGGLFDFYSGNTRRAPRWLRELGLEWLYRIVQEPGRMWRRYLIGNPLFLFRILKWKRQSVNN